jgi:glutamyl-tRNA synthetase
MRIEDTDRTRFVEGATDRILHVITDYGFNWDEGPIFQSARLPIYKSHAQELVEKKAAYYCFCTEERLTQMREEQKSRGVSSTKYDRHCYTLTPDQVQERLSRNEAYVIRLKVPDEGVVSFDDQVFGHVEIPVGDIDDQVLLKSDGFPTYQLAVVVDDHLMGVTHVMRGNDWLPSTPKHVLLYQAFGWEMPIHAHLPNLKELGGSKKLSKRFGAVFAREFLDIGYLPEALLNFLMFLGWNPGGDREIYSLEEFVEAFDISRIHKTDLVSFDRKKLDWYNGYYIRQMDTAVLADRLKRYAPENASVDVLLSLVPLIKDRIKVLSEFTDMTSFFFVEPTIDSTLFSSQYKAHLSAAVSAIESLSDSNYTVEKIGEALMAAVQYHEFKTGDFFMDLRIAISGRKVTPPFNDSIVILGKSKTLSRLTILLP